MTDSAFHLQRFAARAGWANRLLYIDLSRRAAWVEPSEAYIPTYIGGRGILARLAWELCPEPVDPFAPENPLILMTGALTGSRSPYSGRMAVGTFSPQAYPYNWFTRANIGAHWGAELKRAGYDGVVITGASDTPVQIIIRDDEVRIAPADDLWGLDAFDAQDAVRVTTHPEIRTLTIGPAGERLSRIATIHTATSSAAGQGGFGAVMGAKKLKAISVLGTGRVTIAEPERFDALVKAVAEEVRTYRGAPRVESTNEQLKAQCGGRARPYACTAACPTPCNTYYSDMPGVAYPERRWEGHWACVATLLHGVDDSTSSYSHGGLYDWRLGTYGGLEMNVLSNRYGLNQWELIIGMVPWLERCQHEGLVSELNGVSMDWRSPEFWASFLHAVAYREGVGDVLAEGSLRAAGALNLGEDLVRRHYTGWGYAGHWDGHGCWTNYLVYPYWLVSALQWATDTRDPYSSSHCYVQNVMRWGPFAPGRAHRPADPDKDITWEHMRGIGQRLYHSPDALDPLSGYKAKAYPAYYHDKRSVIKDSLPTDDQVFALIYSPNTKDRFSRVAGIDGPSVDRHLFAAGTGTEWCEDDFERAAQRVYTLERALNVRHFGRDRRTDESVLPSFEYKENWVNPLMGEKQALNRGQFSPVLDEYYGYLGWDLQSGRPTQETLADLGLGDVYEPMTAGANRAEATRPAWPAQPAIR